MSPVAAIRTACHHETRTSNAFKADEVLTRDRLHPVPEAGRCFPSESRDAGANPGLTIQLAAGQPTGTAPAKEVESVLLGGREKRPARRETHCHRFERLHPEDLEFPGRTANRGSGPREQFGQFRGGTTHRP